MKMLPNLPRISLQKGNSTFSFLQSGDIFEFACDGFLLNLFRGNGKEGSINNIWLRIYHNGVPTAYPLLGIRSDSQVLRGNNTMKFRGKAEGVDYTVTFYATEDGVWLWDVELSGNAELADVIYGQDIGVAKRGVVLDNELYTAQYLGYSVPKGEHGYVVCARQNMPQDGTNPYLQQGMIRGTAKAFSTDGIQFFGLSSKKTRAPEALCGNLPSKVAQYEFSYTALQSESFSLSGETKSLTFYGLFRTDHADAVRGLEFTDNVYRALRDFESLRDESEVSCPPIRVRKIFGDAYLSPEWAEEKVNENFPVRKLEERQGGKLVSFFTEDHAHVVLQQKELLSERPHGTILTSLINKEKTDSNIITTTNFMFGVFHAQTAVGNTSFHKFLSVHRGSLDLLQNSGQRIYVMLDGQFHLLTLPAVYAMGMNWAKWYYSLSGDTLEITVFCAANTTDAILEVRSANNISYDFIITNQLICGSNEFENPVEVRQEANGRILRFTPEQAAESPYPGLHYDLQMPGTDFTWSDDRIFFEDGQPQNGTLLTLSVPQKSNFQLIIQGRLEDCAPVESGRFRFEEEQNKAHEFYAGLNGGFRLEHAVNEKNHETDKLNEIAWWYTHNAMVHYGAPHGLEQPGGAAWGVRDVCQGPMEYFLATQNYTLARSTLLTVFSHQVLETGEWPQWFMYDRYTQNAGSCHGDIILWPLKCVGDYLDATGDESILSELLPYCGVSGGAYAGEPESLLEHLCVSVSALEKRFLPGTGLISYAGGDWDDTLQPVNESMKKNMTSSWTQALAYQTSELLAEMLKNSAPALAARFERIARRTKTAFADLERDGAITGFAIRRENGSLDFLLHPSDDTTGIHYRLLPMTRSIISGLAKPDETGEILGLIDGHLSFPDGVRLMDCPMEYDGGVSHIFQRAEQAANVGREISLQYTHAHIRYAEAMAKLGEADRAWDALLQINPINIREVVPNAVPRQSNMYFSSSDGDFMNRYEYSRDFNRLRSGTVEVKGGWRLYSSGPGIYLHQLISHILGVRFCSKGLILDPVLPERLDGLRFTYTCFGRPTTFVYHAADNGAKGVAAVRNEKNLDGSPLPNPYRDGGILIQKQDFLAEDGEIHVFYP